MASASIHSVREDLALRVTQKPETEAVRLPITTGSKMYNSAQSYRSIIKSYCYKTGVEEPGLI